MIEKDLKQLKKILHETFDYSLDYLSRLDTVPTGRDKQSHPTSDLPYVGSGALEVLQRFKSAYEDLLVASPGPRYFGYVTGGVTPAAIVGDWLTSVFDQNTQSEEDDGDISAVIEKEAIRMLLELLSLPDKFNGGFVTGATMSNFTCLAVARQWAGYQQGYNIAIDGIKQPIAVVAATPHSSTVKAMSMLGLGSKSLYKVPTNEGRESIDIEELIRVLDELKDIPVILVSSGGTVNTVDFDDMRAIRQLRSQYDFWWHVDAAFGGFVACSSDYQMLLEGWEMADSITVDCHKWLNTPYDGAVFFTRKEHASHQMQTFQNSNAPYLGDPGEKFSYLNFVPENSRRFRALPAWFTLMAYGRKGYQEIVDNCIDLASQLGDLIEESIHFKLLSKVRVNVVAFTFRDESLNQDQTQTARFLHELNIRGKVFLTPTKIGTTFGFRAALVNWRTSKKDIQITLQELNETFAQVFKQTLNDSL